MDDLNKYFGPTIIDKDEWRDKPIRHRFVHGRFKDTYTYFTICLPELKNYGGRFFQFLQGGTGGKEEYGYKLGYHLFAFNNKGYFVESNQGHTGDLNELKGDASILSWKASAATAIFSKQLAKEMYGDVPHHGYLYGGSGGGVRSIACAEAPVQIWDGFIPFMITQVDLFVYCFSIAAWADLLLRERIDKITDATDPGGNGNPFSVLETIEQKSALTTLYRAGYPRGAEQQLVPNPLWLAGISLNPYPSYWNIFWTEPGFEGYDKDPLVKRFLIDEDLEVLDMYKVDLLLKVLKLPENIADTLPFSRDTIIAFRVKEGHTDRYVGCNITLNGGRIVACTHNAGDIIITLNELKGLKDDLQIGDIVHIDNKNFIAFCFLHRHFINNRNPNMRQFLIDGKPIFKQIAEDKTDNYPLPSGKFKGKMILFQHTTDRECWPEMARAYMRVVKKQLNESLDDQFRLYWTENAAHLPWLEPKLQTRYINYIGIINQALKDLIKWVEEGISPLPSTEHEFSDDQALLLPNTASKRKGFQPVLSASVNGEKRAEIKVGESVILKGEAECPPGAGFFVKVEWDFDGTGTFSRSELLNGMETKIIFSVEHKYKKPGTYFATFRASAHREGNKIDRFHYLINQDRIRIVVS